MFSVQAIVGYLVFATGILYILTKLWTNFLGKIAFAWINQTLFQSFKELFTARKCDIFACLQQMPARPMKVVEIGAGVGANFEYLPSNSELVCVDPNEYSKKHLLSKAAEYPQLKVTFEVGVAENLSSIATESVDVVIGTHVLCSVSDVDQCLREVLRVLKKGGVFIFLEHIEAVKGSRIQFWQHLLKSPWSFLLQGCKLTRSTDVSIEKAGFCKTKIDVFEADFKKYVTLTSVLRRHCAGVATK